MARLINVAYVVAYYAGVIRMFYWLNRHKIVVLTYHNVLPDPLFDLSLHLGVSHSASVFRAHLHLIRRRFRISRWPTNSGTCVITFDDGYKNQWEIAGPILAEFDAPAIYFVLFKHVEDRTCAVVDDVLKWMSYAPDGDYTLFGERLLLAKNARGDAFSKIYADLLRHPDRWNSIRGELNKAAKFDDLKIDKELARLRFTPLQPSELADMRAAGHQIGCHSWEHLPLASLQPWAVEKDFQQCESKRDLYANTLLYSYPFGSSPAEVTNDVAVQCARSGFQWAFINVHNIRELNCDSQYAVPRMMLPNSASRYLIEAKLSGFEGMLKRVLRR